MRSLRLGPQYQYQWTNVLSGLVSFLSDGQFEVGALKLEKPKEEEGADDQDTGGNNASTESTIEDEASIQKFLENTFAKSDGGDRAVFSSKTKLRSG